MADKRILITGGAGFIGSHLAEAYLNNDWSVGIVDNFSTGKKANLNGLDVEIYEGDILDPKWLESVFERFQPSHVSHHAAQVSVRDSLNDPANDAAINIIGKLHIADLASKHKVKQLIFASSGGSVYGESPRRQPSRESDPTQPLSPYAIAKLAGEHYLNFYQRHHNLPVTILRYGNVYGPRQDPTGEAGVITTWLNKFQNDEPATIHGTGDQVRDFIFIDDLVAANQAATNNRVLGTFNVASGQITSVNQLYELVAKAWQTAGGQNPKPATMGPVVPGEVTWSQLDISNAQQQLDWQPQTSLPTGLEGTVIWFRENVLLSKNSA